MSTRLNDQLHTHGKVHTHSHKHTSADQVCSDTVLVPIGQWLGPWLFDLELRGQAADGRPAGHFHLKDPRGPPHLEDPLPPFTCISFSPAVDAWMVYECAEAAAIHFSLTGGLMERSTRKPELSLSNEPPFTVH